MFGLFKKKAPPAPVHLSDEELDLVCGGGQGKDSEGDFGGRHYVHEFSARDAMAAVVGRTDGSVHKL
jgi:hypothetical protein